MVAHVHIMVMPPAIRKDDPLNKKIGFFTALSTMGVLLLAIVPASADVIVYTDRASWNAAVSSPTVVNYNDVSGGGTFLGSPFAHDGVTLSNSANYIFGYDHASSNPCPTGEGTCILLRGGVTNDVSFAGLEAGVGADFGITNASQGTLTVAGTSAAGHAFSQTFVVPFGSSSYSFVGFTAAAGDTINSFTVNDLSGNTNFVIDNVSYAGSLSAPTATPEPSSLLLFGSSAAGLFGFLRRRK
jgi:hypothetical protein